MLHTQPQGHWPFGSGEEDFWRVFTIYGHGSHLGHVTQTPWTNFCSPTQLKLHTKFGFDRPSGFGEDLWKWWMTNGRMTTDGWWTDHGYTTSSPMSLKAVHMKKAWILSYPLNAQRRLIRLGGFPGWSESSLGAHTFCWFCHVVAHIQIMWGFL